MVFVPALAGLGAPHWRPEARGLFAGIDRATTAAHLARAVLEGIALQIHDLAEAMRQDSGRDIPAFKVDGGAAANDLLMQFQADVLGAPVVRPKNLRDHQPGRGVPRRPGRGRLGEPGGHPRARGRRTSTFKPKMKADGARARTWPSGSARWSGRREPAHGTRSRRSCGRCGGCRAG